MGSQWAVNQIKKSTCTNSLFSVLLSWEPLLPLMPRLMLMPTTASTLPCTTPTPTAPVLPDTPEPLPLSSPDLPRDLARGPLMPKPRLMLTTATTDTVTVMVIMVDTEVTTDILMDTDTTGKWRELFC